MNSQMTNPDAFLGLVQASGLPTQANLPQQTGGDGTLFGLMFAQIGADIAAPPTPSSTPFPNDSILTFAAQPYLFSARSVLTPPEPVSEPIADQITSFAGTLTTDGNAPVAINAKPPLQEDETATALSSDQLTVPPTGQVPPLLVAVQTNSTDAENDPAPAPVTPPLPGQKVDGSTAATSSGGMPPKPADLLAASPFATAEMPPEPTSGATPSTAPRPEGAHNSTAPAIRPPDAAKQQPETFPPRQIPIEPGRIDTARHPLPVGIQATPPVSPANPSVQIPQQLPPNPRAAHPLPSPATPTGPVLPPRPSLPSTNPAQSPIPITEAAVTPAPPPISPAQMPIQSVIPQPFTGLVPPPPQQTQAASILTDDPKMADRVPIDGFLPTEQPRIGHDPASRPSGQSHAPVSLPQLAPMLATLAQTGATTPMDIALAPEELGRLRLQMVADGDAIHVVVMAERPETLDLLRRHSDQLMTELRQSGFSTPSFSFGSWGDAPPQQSARQDSTASQPSVETEQSPTPTALSKSSMTGLDLRL